MSKNFRVAVVIPAFNEGSVIYDVVKGLSKALALEKFDSEIVVVDDGSKDNTAKQAQAAGARVISHILNTGSGGADISFNYGFTPGYPVVGDWDGNGTTTIGSVSSAGTWAIRNSNSSGAPNGTFQFSLTNSNPIVW